MVVSRNADPHTLTRWLRQADALSAAGAGLAGLALFFADRIVSWLHAGMPLAWPLLAVPATLLAATIEMLVPTRASASYGWRDVSSTVAAATIGMLAILFAAIRIGEPVTADPTPWIVLTVLVMAVSIAIGYGLSLRARNAARRDPASKGRIAD